jgi:Carboxypeptidase regulatory-like domain/TonB-dependent Receptor Plug Domain
MKKLGVLFLLLICFAVGVFAQDATGRIVGVVTDSSGSVVPKAKITVTNVATGATNDVMANEDGSYQILLLPIGTYRVRAEAPGFRKTETGGDKLEINQSLKIDIKLEVGSTSETIQVEANVSGVETVNSQIATSVTGAAIHDLPLNGRNVMSLASTLPGVIPTSGTTAGGVAFSIAGGRPDSVTFLLDGGINNNLLSNALVINPNPDAIQEFRVLTSNYNAEYGRNAGGIVSVVTQSGGNTFHGSGYDFVRNNDFNANSFFNNQQGLPVSILKRNQFGGVIGGPVLIPKVINGRNKLFFFVAYQGQRLSQLSTSSKITTFTPTELKGDFSRSNAAQTGPDTKVVSFLQQYPYFQPNGALAAQGIIDPSKINPVAANYIKSNLIQTASNGSLFFPAAGTNNADELTEKIDYVVTDRDRIQVTLGSSRNPILTPGNPGYPYVGNALRYSGTVSYIKSISANMLNEFRFNAVRNNALQASPNISLPKPTDLGIGITSDDPTGPTILGFNSGLTAGFSPQGPTGLIDNTYTWSDVFTWTKGRHGIKAGFSYTPYQNNTTYDFYVNGEFFFYGTGGGSFSQNDHADFLLGLPDEYLQFGRAPSNIRTHNISGFVQDEWKVRRNLTVSLGLRYEFSSPKLDLQGRSFSLGYGQQSTVFPNAPKGLLFPGDPGAPLGANQSDKNDWAPRIGFAWDPRGNGKMSIRGGVGVFFDILKGEDNLQFNGQAPFFGFADLFFDPLSKNPTAPVNYLSSPFVATGQPNSFPSRPPAKNLNFDNAGFLPFGGGGVYFVSPNLRTPYVYQYNLSVQREIFRNTTLEVSYIGSDSHKLTGLKDANPYVKSTGARLFNTAAPGGFSYLEEFDNVGQANYNSLAVGLNRRYSSSVLGQLQYQVSYTYGKSMDNESGFRSTGTVPAYNFNQFRAVSDFDLKHFISIAGQWEIPFAKLWSTGPKRLTGGWTLDPIITDRTGTPLNVGAGLSVSGSKPGPSGNGDSNLVKANLVKQVTFYDPKNYQTGPNGRTGNFYFDPTAFSNAGLSAINGLTNPAAATYGTLGRNALRGPSLLNFNIALSKTMPIYRESVKLELRGEFFNVFNHTEFNNPSTSITSGSFGQISGTADPRIIQIAGRISF